MVTPTTRVTITPATHGGPGFTASAYQAGGRLMQGVTAHTRREALEALQGCLEDWRCPVDGCVPAEQVHACNIILDMRRDELDDALATKERADAEAADLIAEGQEIEAEERYTDQR